MTVGYMRDVATANTWTFIKLLFRWNGSVWKSIHMELIVWLFIYVNIRNIYEFFMVGTASAETYEHVVQRCRQISSKCRTVMTFAIGFFVTYVSGRWWNIFMTIPWPDSCALQLTAFLRVRGARHEQEDRLFRENIMRYLWLSYVLVFRDVSVSIKKRFPEVKKMIPTLLTQDELMKLNKASKEMRHWVPIEWILDYLRTAKKRCLLDEFHYIELNQTILNYRQQLHEILSHDSITVPLVYVQSVHICTICYFIITCFSSQTIHSDHDSLEGVIDFYLPVYAMIEFIVFVGWLKTAFVMLNPFGMDDDDFDMNALIERNMMVSLSYVNDFYDKPPKLVDIKVRLPTNLQDVVRENANPMHGSAVPVKMTRAQQAIIDDPQIANFVSNVLPSRRASVTNLHTHPPINEFPNIDKSAAMMANNATDDEKADEKADGKADEKGEKEEKKDDEESDKKPEAPNNSAKDTDVPEMRPEVIDAVVRKLLKMKADRKEEDGKRTPGLSPEQTQKSWLVEEPTQKTWVDDGPSVLQKKISKIKPKHSKADVRPTPQTSHGSTRKPVLKPASTMQLVTPNTSSRPPKKKEVSKKEKKDESASLKVDVTQSGENN